MRSAPACIFPISFLPFVVEEGVEGEGVFEGAGLACFPGGVLGLVLGDLLLCVEEDEEEEEGGRCWDLLELLASDVEAEEEEGCLGLLTRVDEEEDEEEGGLVCDEVFSGVDGLEEAREEAEEEWGGGVCFFSFSRSHFSFCACLYSSICCMVLAPLVLH